MTNNEKRNIALSSVAAAIVLTGFKLTVGIATNSLGILSEAAHSGLDLLAAVITLVAVSIADRPADHDHQYGHGKVENISAFVETILLVFTCGWIIVEAVKRLESHTSHVEASVWSFVVMGVSIIVDISRSRALRRVAIKHHSQALEADALHFSSDIWSSLTVIVGLLFVVLGYPFMDAVVAIVVALLVLFVSYRLGRRTIDALMDRVPAGLRERIEETIRNVEGVETIRSVRLRTSGSKVFIDATVSIRRTLPFERAHRIMDNIEKAIHAGHTNVDVIIHAEPVESQDETITDKIRMIVQNLGLRAPHNLEVHLIDGKFFVDFDVEYQKGETFQDAHNRASDIEHAIQQELPSVGKVTIHMEEYLPIEHELDDVTHSDNKLKTQIQDIIATDKRVLKLTDFALLQEGNKYSVTLSCQLEKTRTLEEIHRIISELETVLYQRFKQLRRITIHAEPN
ncbi:MAG TPA: cation diffusion facilitator family transporter [Bacteroidota bacterium]